MVTFINITTVVLSLVSAFTTWQGLAYANRLAETPFQRDVIPFAVAVASFLMALAFWMSLFKWYPKVDRAARKTLNTYVIPFIVLMVFFASTLWSIIGIGGVSAMAFHMRNTADLADKTLAALTEQVEKEASLKQPLSTLSQQFATLAKQEEAGAFSSFPGKVDVVSSLQTTSETLGNLAKAIDANTNERRSSIGEVREEISRLRRLVDDPKIAMTDKIVRFSSSLTNVNQLFQRIHSGEITRMIRSMNDRLVELSAVTPPEGQTQLAIAQREAIERLAKTVDAAKSIVSKSTDEMGETSTMDMESLATISVGMAVLRYWYTIIGEIVASIALDFAPAGLLVILVLTATVRKEEKKEEKEEEIDI